MYPRLARSSSCWLKDPGEAPVREATRHSPLHVDSPEDQGARLAGTEVLVPSVVEREVGVIIVEQVELDRVISRAIEEDLVKRPSPMKPHVGSACETSGFARLHMF